MPSSRKTALTLRRQRSYARSCVNRRGERPESSWSPYECSNILSSATSEAVGISKDRGNSLLCRSTSFSPVSVTLSQSQPRRSSTRKCSSRVRSPQKESSMTTSKSSTDSPPWRTWTARNGQPFTLTSIQISWLFDGIFIQIVPLTSLSEGYL